MINLRKATTSDHQSDPDAQEAPSKVSTLGFVRGSQSGVYSRRIGNIGESLVVGGTGLGADRKSVV